MKKYLKLILKTVVSIALITVVLWQVDRETLFQKLSMMDVRYIPLIVGLLIANYVFSSIRWKKLLIFEKTSHISVWYLTSLYFVGSFFNNFMPTSIGGDVYKIYRLSKKLGNMAHSFASTFMERFSGVLALVVLSILAMYRYIGLWTLGVLMLFILGFLFGLLLLKLLSTRVVFFKKVYDALYLYKDKWGILVFAFITSFIVQLCSVFTQHFIYSSIGVNIPVLYSLMVFPAIILASFFIPSLNGIGVQDALFVAMFAQFASPEVSLSASILFHLFRLGVSLIGGVFYALDRD